MHLYSDAHQPRRQEQYRKLTWYLVIYFLLPEARCVGEKPFYYPGHVIWSLFPAFYPWIGHQPTFAPVIALAQLSSQLIEHDEKKKRKRKRRTLYLSQPAQPSRLLSPSLLDHHQGIERHLKPYRILGELLDSELPLHRGYR